MIKRVIEELEGNRQRRLNGDLIAIPWSTLPRLNEVLPGVQQGKYYLVAGRPKAAKTQMADYLFVYEVFDWWWNNRDKTDIVPKIDYFSLEMSSKLKWISAISYKLFKMYGIIISPQKLQSVFKNYILDQKVIDLIKGKEFQTWLKAFEDHVTYYDNIRNPTGIFKKLKAYAESRGEWSYKTMPWENNDGSIGEKQVKDKFISKYPNEYHIGVTDHYSLLARERGQTLFDAIQRYSSEYCINLRDAYNMTMVGVQQISAAAATAEYSASGKIIIDKVLPSDSDLSDNKHTAMDVNVMLSLFWPYKYKIPEFEGWDITRIGNNHRQLRLNLNRDVISSASVELAFLGACNYFKELPPIEKTDQVRKAYNQIEHWNEITI